MVGSARSIANTGAEWNTRRLLTSLYTTESRCPSQAGMQVALSCHEAFCDGVVYAQNTANPVFQILRINI